MNTKAVMTRPKKLKLTWWALHDVPDPVVHAIRDGRKVAMCGGKKTKKSYEVRGPVTIAKHKRCVRCDQQLDRIAMMQ